MEHRHQGPAAATWGMAAQATLHCLTGCAIGEVLGMVIGTVAGLHNAATVVVSIALAFVFGYGLTMRGVLRAGVNLRTAFTVALAADTMSIAVMELLETRSSWRCRARWTPVWAVSCSGHHSPGRWWWRSCSRRR
jgi:hypothetical protein